MSAKPYLLGIDQGTSGSRALVLDREGQVRGYGYRPLPRLYPRPDWVEQDPDVLAAGVAEAIAEALGAAGCRPDEVAACGIDCQRNTEFAWDARTGRPVGRAVTWQDLRTLPMVEALGTWPLAGECRRRLGYLPGPYSSALHLAWRMRHAGAMREAAHSGDLRIGLSAAWLMVALGRQAGHWMDYSLVQSLGLYDFREQDYWGAWLDYLALPRSPFPEACPTLHDYGTLRLAAPGGAEADVPVTAMIGDQQAALFGYDCRTPGDAECTHGTASFVDVFLGAQAPEQENLNVYFAWHLGDAPTYCLEADTTVTGAAVRWMRENLRIIDRDDELGVLAASVPNAGGVTFVPAFTGLNVPYHDRSARGTLMGMSLGSTRAHVARAFLEAIGYQVRAILETIREDTGLGVTRLHVGGGLAASDAACQIQADLLGIPVIRPEFPQTSARAAALLAGLGAGIWDSPADLPPLPGERHLFEPTLSTAARDAGYDRWQRAVALVRRWGAEQEAR